MKPNKPKDKKKGWAKVKSRIYYAICFEQTDSMGRTIGYDDPTQKGAWALFYRRSTALEHASATDKIERVKVTIEPIVSKKKPAK